MTAVAPPAVCKADQPRLPFLLISICSLLRNSNTVVLSGSGVEWGRKELLKSSSRPVKPILPDSLLMERGDIFYEYFSENQTSDSQESALREALGRPSCLVESEQCDKCLSQLTKPSQQWCLGLCLFFFFQASQPKGAFKRD